MNLDQTLRVLLRNWFVLLPALLLSGMLTVGGYLSTPPQYEVHESMLFLPPALPSTGNEPGTNPYLTFGTSINITAKVFAQLLASDDLRAALARQGATASYTVLPTVDGTPVLQVSASDPRQSVAQVTLRSVDAFVAKELAARQLASGAPQSTWIRSSIVTDPQPPSATRSSGLRLALAIAAAGAVLSFALPFLLEWWTAVRRRRARLDARRVADLRPFEPVAEPRRPSDRDSTHETELEATPTLLHEAGDSPR